MAGSMSGSHHLTSEVFNNSEVVDVLDRADLQFTKTARADAHGGDLRPTVELYAAFYDHEGTTAVTYINDKIVVCLLEDILTHSEDVLLADGARGEVIDGRVAFQTETEDEFTVAIERLTIRHVVAFLSANQTTPGVACELFFLDAAPRIASTEPSRP